MSHHPTLPHAITLNAVIEPGHIHHDECRQVRLIHEHGSLDALTWEPIPKVPAACLRKAVAHLIPVGQTEHGLHVVTRFEWCHTMDALSLVPHSFGTTDEVVARCRDVVDAMATKPLRRFLGDVFNTPAIFYEYWDTPLEHRGAPGSLALDAVALAEAVQDSRTTEVRERDVAITFALIRHVGAIWCLRDDWSNGYEISQQELVALSQLDGPFDQLAYEAPALATALRELMLEQRSPARDTTAQAVTKLVARAQKHQAILAEIEAVHRYRHEEIREGSPPGGNVIEFPRLPIGVRAPDEHLW
ncbi:hypothetical protein [Lysobacter sp. A289]